MDVLCDRFRFFTGITAILEKCGIRETDSDVAAAIRTIVVPLFSWIVFHEKLTKKSALGVMCITVGTALLAVI